MTDTGQTTTSEPVQPIRVEPLIDPAPQAETIPPAGQPSADDGLMTEIEFHDFIGGLFPLAAVGVMMVDGREYKSLIDAPNLPTAPPAFSALYRTAKRVPLLRWIIERESAWLQDMLVMGAFGGNVFMNFSREWAFYHPVHPSQRGPGQRGAPSSIRVSPAEKVSDDTIIIGGDYSNHQPQRSGAEATVHL